MGLWISKSETEETGNDGNGKWDLAMT